MCFGDSKTDTLVAAEREALLQFAGRHLPTYGAHARSNDDDQCWIVLEPPNALEPRFTICRIEPCVLVMIEMAGGERRFRSLRNVEDAMACACHAVHQTALERYGVMHQAPGIAQ